MDRGRGMPVVAGYARQDDIVKQLRFDSATPAVLNAMQAFVNEAVGHTFDQLVRAVDEIEALRRDLAAAYAALPGQQRKELKAKAARDRRHRTL